VTPTGTKPGERPVAARPGPPRVATSSRYTPPVPKELKESPPWLPVVMLALLVAGGVVIMLRYLVFTGSNWPTLVGLVCILGGLYLATKWR